MLQYVRALTGTHHPVAQLQRTNCRTTVYLTLQGVAAMTMVGSRAAMIPEMWEDMKFNTQPAIRFNADDVKTCQPLQMMYNEGTYG